jgi:hypothetical protein
MTREDGSFFSMAWGRFLFVAVWLVYCAMAFLLAHWNVTAHAHPHDTRLLFSLLAVAAWFGFWFALVGSPYLRPRSPYRHLGLLVLSFAGLFFSSWLWVFVVANTYGE